jgi:CDP-diacylglycerol--serine O-phosphatidyltransferase
MPGISGEVIASIPLIMGAIRLARFNTIEDKPTDSFIGLPTPVNALAIASLVLFMENFKLVNPEYSQPRLLLPLILSLSYLMVSRVQYPKFPLLSFNAGKQNNFRLFGVILFVICFLAAILTGYPYRVLAVFIACYIISGLIKHAINLGNIETKRQET